MNKSFKLTEKGEQELEAFKNAQVHILLDNIIKSKDYPGINEIEITANDITEFSKNWIYSQAKRSRNHYARLKIISYVYMVMGTLLFITSIFYQDIERMVNHNPEQLLIMLLGVVVSSLGIILLVYSKLMNYRKNYQTKEGR